MTASDWLKVPGYGQRGVDILADLEAMEKEFVDYKVDCCATHEADNEECMKAEAERAAISKEWNDWASSHSEWIVERTVLLAERDALKTELADVNALWRQDVQRLSARIRACRAERKEAENGT